MPSKKSILLYSRIIDGVIDKNKNKKDHLLTNILMKYMHCELKRNRKSTISEESLSISQKIELTYTLLMYTDEIF